MFFQKMCFQTDPKLFEKGESIFFSGKCVAALAADPNVLASTGRVLTTTELAERYELRDVDGCKKFCFCWLDIQVDNPSKTRASNR